MTIILPKEELAEAHPNSTFCTHALTRTHTATAGLQQTSGLRNRIFQFVKSISALRLAASKPPQRPYPEYYEKCVDVEVKVDGDAWNTGVRVAPEGNLGAMQIGERTRE
jgi:hypothetical protein